MKTYFKFVLWLTLMLINNGILIPYLISAASTFYVILGYISFFGNVPLCFYFAQWLNIIPSFKKEEQK
jgi:hypothetical protein